MTFQNMILKTLKMRSIFDLFKRTFVDFLKRVDVKYPDLERERERERERESLLKMIAGLGGR